MSEETTDKFANWPLTKMTAQEVFDTVKNHLLKQGKPSIINAVCRYRGPAGLKCAAGILIEDDEYAAGLDGYSDSGWSNLVSLGKVPTEHYELIRQLQIVHDESEPDQWAKQLRVVASNAELVYETKDNNAPSND